jgi:putative transposase
VVRQHSDTSATSKAPVPHGGAIGIDMGIARFATLSDGTFYAPLHSFKRHEAALRRVQRAMSRKTKFSNNWKKAKARVQKIHSRIGNARRDYLHKTTTTPSAKTTRWCVSRTCRYGICPSQRQVAPSNRARMFGPNPA